MKTISLALVMLFVPFSAAHAGGFEDAKLWQANLSNGTLQMKQDPASQWVAVSNNVKNFQIESHVARIGVLTNDGNFRVKEGGLNAPWDNQETRVVSFQLDGDRMGVLRNDGNFEVKAGRLDGQWFGEETNVTAFRLAGDRIGVLKSNGILRVKEGKLDGAWDDLNTNVVSFRMEGKRIHVILSNGSHLMKDGSLSAAWQPE